MVASHARPFVFRIMPWILTQLPPMQLTPQKQNHFNLNAHMSNKADRKHVELTRGSTNCANAEECCQLIRFLAAFCMIFYYLANYLAR